MILSFDIEVKQGIQKSKLHNYITTFESLELLFLVTVPSNFSVLSYITMQKISSSYFFIVF